VNPFQYTGRESDPETGLYYYRARYYDAAVGKFVSEDPIRFNADANFYAYVGNGPVLFRDPLGLCRIVVNFTKIWGLFNSHAYIVTTDATGSMGFRGGPGEDGNIATLYGPYDKFFPDSGDKTIACKTVLDNNDPCTKYNVALETALDQIDQDKIPYHFLSTNSNAVVSEALRFSHLPVPTPPVSAPGWNTPLFPFGNGGPKIGPPGPVGGGGAGGLQ
jgi:RHS repeat-associated protein